MNIFIIGIIIFVISVLIIELSIYAYKNMRAPKRAKIRKKLRKYSYISAQEGSMDILKNRVFSDTPFVDNLLHHIPGVERIDRFIVQANAIYNVGSFILLSLFLGLSGFLTGILFFKGILIPLVISALMSSLIFLHVLILKQKREAKFRKQFPEALDLIARSLRVGHAFTSGLGLAAEEFDDPLGPEFAEALDEINFGVSVSNALKNLTDRVDCSELRYFVISVNLQRETGGNLSEILENLASLIRENFMFQGRVEVLSSEGKLSAIILTILPFIVAIYLKIVNPKYLDKLFNDPVGKYMLVAAGIMMVLGILTMKKMVVIKV